jgi:hypothetical protein
MTLSATCSPISGASLAFQNPCSSPPPARRRAGGKPNVRTLPLWRISVHIRLWRREDCSWDPRNPRISTRSSHTRHMASQRVNITPAANPAPGSGPQAQFGDPFASCAVLGTIDAPDSRYIGPKVPEVVAQGLKKAFGAPRMHHLDHSSAIPSGATWTVRYTPVRWARICRARNARMSVVSPLQA